MPVGVLIYTHWYLLVVVFHFKAAKILVDLLKTVEQSLNFDIVSNDDKSTTSYDTTEKTGISPVNRNKEIHRDIFLYILLKFNFI